MEDREQADLLKGLEETDNYDFWSDIIIGRYEQISLDLFFASRVMIYKDLKIVLP